MKKITLSLIVLSGLAFAGSGESLYAKCAGCHGSNGEKAALGKSAIITGQDTGLTEKQLKGYKAGTLNQHGMGSIMKGQMATFSDEDIIEISKYISTMK